MKPIHINDAFVEGGALEVALKLPSRKKPKPETVPQLKTKIRKLEHEMKLLREEIVALKAQIVALKAQIPTGKIIETYQEIYRARH